MSWSARIALVALIGSVACSPSDEAPQEPPRAPEADVFAVYDGGEITRTEFDDAILKLPPAARLMPRDTEAVAWIEERTRSLALNDLLLRAALASGWEEDAEFQRAFEEALRDAAANRYLARELPAAERPDESELRRRFDAQPGRALRSEMRLVHHWFLRIGPVRGAEDARAELVRLRERYLAGESFADLARAHSESQTRHTGGSLGWLSRAALPAGLAAMVFELAQGATSQPVEHGGGLHVFLVEQVLPEQRMSFEELRGALAQEWLQEQHARAIDAVVAGLPVPEDSSVPSAQEALAILRETSDPETPVLRIGGFTLRAGDLMQRVQAAELARPGRPPEAVVAGALRAVTLRESVALLEGDGGKTTVGPEVRQALRDTLLVQRQHQRGLRRWAEESDLDAWYEANRARFSTPLRLELRSYRLPLGSDPNRRMARLESWWSEGSARSGLEGMVREWRGEIEEVVWRTIPQLAAEGFPGAPLLADLAAGKISPPYRVAGHLQVIEVLAREEPTPRPLEDVREAVVAGYLQEHGQRLFAAWSESLLEEAGYRSFPDHFRPVGVVEARDDADR